MQHDIKITIAVNKGTKITTKQRIRSLYLYLQEAEIPITSPLSSISLTSETSLQYARLVSPYSSSSVNAQHSSILEQS